MSIIWNIAYLWKATYAAETPEELNEAYRRWACDYDRDTCDQMGYIGPETAARLLDRQLDSKRCRVLDAGCGRGLVVEVLAKFGYCNLEAMDYSPDMIGEAEKKDVYRLKSEDVSCKLCTYQVT